MSRGQHDAGDPRSVCLAVITVSDTRTAATDTSGALIRELSIAAGHTIAEHGIVPDEPERVRALLTRMLAAPGVEAVLINGGTGISGRDRTFEAVSVMFERRIDGFGELFRVLSYHEIGAAAMLSRAVAGLIAGRPVFAMPGSTAAVRLAMEKLILPELGHVVAQAGKQGGR